MRRDRPRSCEIVRDAGREEHRGIQHGPCVYHAEIHIWRERAAGSGQRRRHAP